MSPLPASLVLVGAGKMGGAMLEGWLRLGLDPRGTIVLDPHVAVPMRLLCAQAGVALNPPLLGVSAPQVLVLAIKPQMLDAAAPGIQHLAGPGTLALSILAGKTLADLAQRLPACPALVRAMPNLPASIGRGISGACASALVSPSQHGLADALLRAVGQVEWLADETLIDAVTAVSGSGPAYVFALVEALALAGEKLGLPPELAMGLARATVEGAGELMFRQPELSARRLRENVTSPGGTTEAALTVLQGADGLAPLMARAIRAAHRRAGELSG